MSKEISILVVDDHPIVGEGILSLLGDLPFAVSEHAATAAAALVVAASRQFGIAIIDLELPDSPGILLIEKIRKASPATRIIVYTMHEELWALHDLAEAKPDGIVFKSESPRLLREAVRAVGKGGTYRSPHCQELERGSRRPVLGYSARQVLLFLADGLSSKQIAERVFRSENTVEYHRKRLMRFFGAANTTQLILKAAQQGYVRPQTEASQ